MIELRVIAADETDAQDFCSCFLTSRNYQHYQAFCVCFFYSASMIEHRVIADAVVLLLLTSSSG